LSETQLIQNRWYILRLKLHVSAFIGHPQVSTIIEDESIYAVKLCGVVDLEISNL